MTITERLIIKELIKSLNQSTIVKSITIKKGILMGEFKWENHKLFHKI